MIIFLNGASSAGKSTLARELQKQLDEPYFLLGLDAFLEPMLPPSCNFENPEDFQAVLEATSGFNSVIGEMAKCLDFLIIDHVLQFPSWHLEVAKALKGQDVLFVGVLAPLTVLEARESERSDRQKGTARAQYDVVQNYTYDVKIDSSQYTPAKAAQIVIQNLKPGQALFK